MENLPTSFSKKNILKPLVYLFCLIGFVAISYQVYTKIINKNNSSQSPSTSQINPTTLKDQFLSSYIKHKLPDNFAYSFYIDDDKDGLSNAKEIIYGTDPENPDTNANGYKDGEEVKKGYDPLTSANQRLEDRQIYNYSIDYFSWVQKNKNIDDPVPDDNLIQEFFQKKLGGKIDLSYPDNSDIKINNNIDIKSYFDAVSKISIPKPNSKYTDIIKDPSSIDFKNLQDLISRFELTYSDLKNIEVPSVAKDYHYKLMTVIRNMISIFQDISSFYLDPVKIYLNNYKFYELIKLGLQEEIIKKNLLNKK